MSIRIIYCQEPERVIPAVLIDNRANIPAITNVTGFAIKAYTDAQVAMIVPGVLPYRLETDMGNLAGFMTLQTSGGGAGLYQFVLRPAFLSQKTEILGIISNFIMQGNWKADFLV